MCYANKSVNSWRKMKSTNWRRIIFSNHIHWSSISNFYFQYIRWSICAAQKLSFRKRIHDSLILLEYWSMKLTIKSSCSHCNRLCRKKAWSVKCEELSCNGSVFAYCSITYPKQRSLFVALCTPNGAFNVCLKLLKYLIVRIVLTTWTFISVSIRFIFKTWKCAQWNSRHVLWECFKTEWTKLLQLNLLASQLYISQIVNFFFVVGGEKKSCFLSS